MLINYFETLDKKLFIFFNSYHNIFFDKLMFVISAKFTWLPLYLILLILIIFKFKKKSIFILLSIAILITCSDQFSVFLKNFFQRYRPCHNSDLKDIVHIVNNYCGGMYGFVSSHSANSFALANFIFLLFKKSEKYKFIGILMFFWAAIVSYSRLYLGVHYPSDLIGGAITGIFFSYLIYFLYKNCFKLFNV